MKSTFIFVITMILGTLLALSGCTSADDVKAIQDSLAAQQTFLTEQRAAAVTEQTAAAAAGDTQRAENATKTIVTIDKTVPILTKVQAGLATATNPDGSINAGGVLTTVAATLPPPYGLLAGLSGVVLTGLIGEWRRKQAVGAAKSIVNSIDVLRSKSSTVSDAMQAHKKAIQDQLTPLAEKIVKNERLDS